MKYYKEKYGLGKHGGDDSEDDAVGAHLCPSPSGSLRLGGISSVIE